MKYSNSETGFIHWLLPPGLFFIICIVLIFGTFLVLPASGRAADNIADERINGEDISPESKEKKAFKEESSLIAKIPENGLIVAESIKHRVADAKVAYVYEGESGFKVCMNGNCGPYVDAVAKGMPIVSPDGNHVAAVVQKDGKSRILLNDQLGRGFDMILALVFSPDSMKLAYIATEGDEAFVFVNQERHQSFPIIDSRQGLLFSNDSQHLAYVAGKGRQWQIVHDKEPGPVFEEIGHLTFSPDSRRLVYAAKEKNQWHLIEGDSKSPGYRRILRVLFSPDSKSLAYIAQSSKGFFMVHNGRNSDIWEVIAGEPIFSPDGKRLAYPVAEKKSNGIQMRLVVDGRPGRPFDAIGPYLFSLDGKQFAYIAETAGKKMVVHGDVDHEAHDWVGIPIFDPRGRHLAYQMKNGAGWHMVKNRVTGFMFDNVSPPIFCPLGERMAYLAGVGRLYAVVEENKVLGMYLWAGDLAFSPDGKHMAYAAASIEGGSGLVVDGQEGYERFFSFLKGAGLTFTDNNTVQGIALRENGGEFWLIRAIIDKK